MKAIMVLFDSLIREMLPAYGCEWVHAPNFARLAERSVTFDTCYAGSMPCVPARRELHTGRYTFLHRGWGPLEPYDDSVPELLGNHGVHSHLVSDHLQYWDDGGSGYPCRYSTFEFVRGQEGEPWKGRLGDPPGPAAELRRATQPGTQDGDQWRQDLVNRQYFADEADHPQTQVFDAALEFIGTNHDQDPWLLHVDAFDPHEPFFTYDAYRARYPHAYDGPHFDWPDYLPVTEPQDAVEHARFEYAALLSQCDASLGRVLDAMDEHALWDDTMLIVCTDHGYLLGEHGWWGKVVQPWYEETIHTPLFVWDPRTGGAGERRRSLVRTVDLGPTLLDHFGVPPTADMQGVPLRATLGDDTPGCDAALFGQFGGHAGVTDGRYVYMRACAEPGNRPLYEYTLMPSEMFGRFSLPRLRQASLVEPFPFTKGVAPLRVPGNGFRLLSPWGFGTLLYDLAADPRQEHPLVDDELELRMARLLVREMRASAAPAEQFERLGLPVTGDPGEEHLLVRRQWHLVEDAVRPAPTAEDLTGTTEASAAALHTPLRTLLESPAARAAVGRHAPVLADDLVVDEVGAETLAELAAAGPGVLPRGALRAIVAALDDQAAPSPSP